MEQIKTAYQELQEVRFELSKASLKKTGKNNYQGFEYFELKDFLPTAGADYCQSQAAQGLEPS